jgi:hypothetical protein
MSSSMGIAVGALSLRMAMLFRGHVHSTPDVVDFHLAFAFVGVLALVAVFDCLQLPPNAGAITSGHRVAEGTEELTQA